MTGGLLDFIKTPEGQGLLSAAFGGLAGAQRGAPINSIGRAGVAGLTGYGNALERQDQQAQLAKRNELFDVQVSALKADAAEKERLRQLEQRRQAALPGLFAGTVTPGSISVPEIGGVEMFSQGPKVEQASVRSGAGQFNVPEAIRSGLFKPEEITQYANLVNAGLPKVARTVEIDNGKGGKETLQLDEFGRPVGQSLPAYIAPVQVNRGDRVDFVRPAPGVSLGMNISPGERAADARARERLTFDKENAPASKAPAGYRYKPDGSLEAIPGGPADIKAGEAGAKAEQRRESAVLGAQSVLKEIQDAKKLVGVSTAGVGGVLQNIPATPARNLSSKLETIKANLGFDRLQQMRDQSPTGGALGAVAVQELTALQSTVASLDQLQSPDQLSKALDKIEGHYSRWVNVMNQASGKGGSAPAGGAQPTVVKTGNYGGRKVEQLSDGTVRYAN